MRRRSLAVIAVYVVACIATTGATAQQTGLLLGIADRGWSHGLAERLTTVWLVRGAGAETTRSMKGLVVPVKSSFQRVIIARECNPRGEDEQNPRIACVDSLVVRPARGTAPQVSRESAASACTTDQLGIAFASPAVLSVIYYGWYSDCSSRSWADVNARNTIAWSTRRAVSFGTLGAGAADAYARAARAARNVNVASDGEGSIAQRDGCQAKADVDTTWAITRVRGHWIPSLYQQNGNELCLLEGAIDWTLPARVIGHTEPTLDWARITTAVPDAEAAWLSPDGTSAVITLPGMIRVYAIEAGVPRKVLFERPRTTEGTDVVMVQWMTGRGVAQWTARLAGVR